MKYNLASQAVLDISLADYINKRTPCGVLCVGRSVTAPARSWATACLELLCAERRCLPCSLLHGLRTGAAGSTAAQELCARLQDACCTHRPSARQKERLRGIEYEPGGTLETATLRALYHLPIKARQALAKALEKSKSTIYGRPQSYVARRAKLAFRSNMWFCEQERVERRL